MLTHQALKSSTSVSVNSQQFTLRSSSSSSESVNNSIAGAEIPASSQCVSGVLIGFFLFFPWLECFLVFFFGYWAIPSPVQVVVPMVVPSSDKWPESELWAFRVFATDDYADDSLHRSSHHSSTSRLLFFASISNLATMSFMRPDLSCVWLLGFVRIQALSSK
jgi:hypothetical protein